MSVGDLFAPLDWFDGLLSFLPLVLRVCMWGALAGGITMAVYMATSPQVLIYCLKQRTADLRRRMMDPDLESAAFWSLSAENLRVSLALLGRVTGPALLSALPVLLLAAWIDAVCGSAVLLGGFGFLPDWALGWETPFFLATLVTTLAIRIAWRVA